MTVHLHNLWGCAPAPLAFYLKALGVLRLVAQQKDAECRGFWKDEHFCIVTSLDRDSLERFFLDEYAPTPLLAPWNRGSGFFAVDDPGLSPIEQSVAPRFAPYRQGVAASRAELVALSHADAEVRRLKAGTKQKGLSPAARKALRDDPSYKSALAAAEREFKRLKADVFGPFARTWRGELRAWMDAAMVLDDHAEPTWPSLLGTGGNDGRLDFTNNYMQHLGRLFDLTSTNGAPRPGSSALLSDALWGTGVRGVLASAAGQYLPGGAGGPNATTGPEGEAQVNPWDFVLMLEGATSFRSQTTRHLDSHAAGRAAVPFALHAQAVGVGSGGREKAERGEQWMPLWAAPSTSDDVLALLGEGRAHVQRAFAQRPLDFARAVAKLGVARGLSGFQRFGYLERNGQSNIAVPLGRLDARPRTRASLIDDLAPWIDRLQRAVRSDASTRLSLVERNLSDGVFTCLTRAEDPGQFQSVLVRAAHVEGVQVTGSGFEAGPLPRLSPDWLEAADDNSPEWRLAIALGSAAAEYKQKQRSIDPVRSHVLPLKGQRYAVSDKRLIRDPRVVVCGRSALADLASIVERRLVEASQVGKRQLSLVAPRGRGARLVDLAMFLEGQLDVDRIVWLARALMALDWRAARSASFHASRDILVDEGWVALRLLGAPYLVAKRRVALDLAVIRRLLTGDIAGAMTTAIGRLRAAGFRPPLSCSTADPQTGLRWAAALAFPIDAQLAEALARRFLTPQDRARNQMETA
ncbi:MAG: type I-U CRISPR-associated protein Csx17 [Polyangiaceae bacterium]